MPWKVKDVMEQRIEFVVRVLQKERRMGQLCEEYGISRTTGYRWLNRYQETGTFLSCSTTTIFDRVLPQQRIEPKLETCLIRNRTQFQIAY